MKVVCPPSDNTRHLQQADLSPRGDIGLEPERRSPEDKIKEKPDDIEHYQRQWSTGSKRAAGQQQSSPGVLSQIPPEEKKGKY